MAASGSKEGEVKGTGSGSGVGAVGSGLAVASGAERTEKVLSDGQVWGVVALNWLIPGAGYLATGDRVRGIWLALLLNGVFLLGVGLQGSVIWPVWNPLSHIPGTKTSDFNVINVLTFVVTCGSGGPSLVCLASSWRGEPVAQAGSDGGSDSKRGGWFAGDESASTFELGVFHLLISGAMNYFGCCALYQRHRPMRRAAVGKKA